MLFIIHCSQFYKFNNTQLCCHWCTSIINWGGGELSPLPWNDHAPLTVDKLSNQTCVNYYKFLHTSLQFVNKPCTPFTDVRWQTLKQHSHEFVVLSDRLGDLGFSDSDSLHLETWSHTCEVVLKCYLQIFVNLVWRGGGGGRERTNAKFGRSTFSVSATKVYLALNLYSSSIQRKKRVSLVAMISSKK